MEEKGEDKFLKLFQDLEQDLEPLDPSEYELPKCSSPSIEDILNESPSDEDDIIESIANGKEFDALLSSFDTVSLASFDDPEGRRKRKIYEGHGDVVRHTVLKGISAQIVNANLRSNSGSPSAISADRYIAIGTTTGNIFVFEANQAMKWSLTSTFREHSGEPGVTCLCFNKDCTRLLAGHSNGRITMWDLTNGKLLRTISDAMPLGTAVLHIKFTDSLVVALCSDSGGSVFDLEFTRAVTGRGCKSKCIFSGSRGEVCSFETLIQHESFNSSNKDAPMLVAMVSFTKVLVVTIRPEVRIVFMFMLPGDPSCLPLLKWRIAPIKVSSTSALFDPVLAVARQSTFHFFQAIIGSHEDVNFQKLQTSEVPYRLLAFSWLNSHLIATIDTSERLHIIDVKSWEELQAIDMSDMHFTFSVSAFKGLSTGGNVSPALARAGMNACYYSMVSFNSQLFLLGKKSVHFLTVRSWKDRIEVLIREERHQDAIALALSFYDGTAKAVIGLPNNPERRRAIVSEKILDILYIYVDLSMTKLCPEFGKIDQLVKHYHNVVPICVDYCLRLNCLEGLFGRLYDRFSQDVIAQGSFLECLEPYIIDDQLRIIPPAIMKDLTAHFYGKDMLSKVENCIIHLDIMSLDLDQTVKLCSANDMYDAFIHIYNQALNDFETPLEKLSVVLHQALSTGKQMEDKHMKLGHKLLVYLSNSLGGLAYPIGVLDIELKAVVKRRMFDTLVTPSSPQHESLRYPYMQVFLDFDTQGFLNVLALAFEETEFADQPRQRMVDILLEIMTDDSSFSAKQVGMLYTFLARQIARHHKSIKIHSTLFQQILEYLCQPGDSTHKEERQEALLELLLADNSLRIDKERLLAMAEHSKLYRVCEAIYKRQRLYDKILLTYLVDSTRIHQAFEFIETTLKDNPNTSNHQKLLSVTTKYLGDLVNNNPEQTAALFTNTFKVNVNSTISILDSSPETQYKLLQALVKSSSEDSDLSALEPDIVLKYIERMCKYDSVKVERFLRSHTGYPSESLYQICARNHLYSAMSFLLEQMGEIQKAFDVIIKGFKSKIDFYLELCQSKKPVTELEILSQQITTLSLDLIAFCQRNSNKLSEPERKDLWFPLLDSVIEPQHKLGSSHLHAELFKELSKQVMNCMMGCIPLPMFMSKMMNELSTSSGRFGDVRELLMAVLSSYNYEQTLYHTVNHMLNEDLITKLSEKRKALSSAFVPVQDRCSYCQRDVNIPTSNPNLVIFRCGHIVHEKCLEKVGACQGEGLQREYSCTRCNPGLFSSNRPSSSSETPLASPPTSAVTPSPVYERSYKERRDSSIDINLRRTPPTYYQNPLLDDT